MIDNKLIIQDTGLAERIITAAGYVISQDSIKPSHEDNLIVVLWNWWIKN